MTRPIYIDTNILIAALETENDISDFAWSVLDACEQGRWHAVTSELTLAELLPKPLQKKDSELVASYEALLSRTPSFRLSPVSRDVLVASAHLRSANASLRLPDAIHVATAQKAGCSAFVTDDLRLPMPPGIRRIRLSRTMLDDLAASA